MERPTYIPKLTDLVQYLKGIGPVRAEALAEVGIFTVEDLLYYFPRKYLDRRNVLTVDQLVVGESASLIGQIVGKGVRSMKRRRQFQVNLEDHTGTLQLVWFNVSDWMTDRFQIGDRVAVSGKVEYYKQLQIIHPEVDFIETDEDPINTGTIVPLYPGSAALKTTGLDSRRLRRIIHQLLEILPEIPDYLPPALRTDAAVPTLNFALRAIHRPADEDQLEKARHRLKFDEHIFLQLLMALRRKVVVDSPGRKFPDLGEAVARIYRSLPFSLTDAQIRVMKEIRGDFQSGRPMNRLLQGDVGSGKTIIALLASAIVADEGAQIAIMVPTEILARQHYQALMKFSQNVDLSIALLTGSTPNPQRKALLERLADGRLALVVGTHALIQDKVDFKDLALIIVDEQHRFGVLQRGKLIKKGVLPHVLAMTATPIPRTLAITYHGDMDVSLLNEAPANRATVKTHVVQPDQLAQVYAELRASVQAGEQGFIVYPVIEESARTDLQAATSAYKELSTKVFPDIAMGFIHGKLKGPDKEAAMAKFSAGDSKILVATTVIEVGIDVPNATIMIIENAERFGLTQLHQLRGRIGRGDLPGRCFLVNRSAGDEARPRLMIMTQTRDGFQIADEDLKLRGSGELFGARQHGLDKMQLADLVNDGPIIRVARQAAFELVKVDPLLQKPEHRGIQKVLRKKYQEQLAFLKIS
ncbi:ATP-dependent DNA helicase RecG [Candidatus Neomarinimicrobiota bacterium]